MQVVALKPSEGSWVNGGTKDGCGCSQARLVPIAVGEMRTKTRQKKSAENYIRIGKNMGIHG